jgi:hypothetical protein
VFVSSLSLFWTKACVEESLHAFLLYLFSYVIFPYMLTSNAFNCVINSSGAKPFFIAVQQSIPGH